MNWLAKLLYRGRVKRLEGVQDAARLMAEGRLCEAENRLSQNAPSRYLLDVAVFHFVKGRLAMEQGDWETAEEELHAAKVLGIKSRTIDFLLGVLKARDHHLDEAFMVMKSIEEEKDDDDSPSVQEIKKLIVAHRDGETLKKIRQRAETFSNEKLNKILSRKNIKQKEIIDALEVYLKEQKSGQPLGEEKRQMAAEFLGEVWVRFGNAQWLLGLDSRDHIVVADGLGRRPFDEIEKYLNGEMDKIEPLS